jgi:hypothetical protein
VRATRLCLMVLSVAVLAVHSAAQRTDIFTALREGTVRAEFRGNGDSSVLGTIERLPGGPTEVVIPAGATFRVAQFGGMGPGGFEYGGGLGQTPGRFGQYGQFGGGGRQGMMGSRSTMGRLGLSNTVRLTLSALCMDYNKPAPTPNDVMVILPPTNAVLGRLAQVLDTHQPAHPAAQLAVWAVANDPPPAVAQRYLLEIIPGAGTVLASQRREIMNLAQSLLSAAGLQPTSFRMFN